MLRHLISVFHPRRHKLTPWVEFLAMPPDARREFAREAKTGGREVVMVTGPSAEDIQAAEALWHDEEGIRAMVGRINEAKLVTLPDRLLDDTPAYGHGGMSKKGQY